MAQLDGVVLTFTSTIMVFSSLQPPLACTGAPSDLRPLDMRAGRGENVLLSMYLGHNNKKHIQEIHIKISLCMFTEKNRLIYRLFKTQCQCHYQPKHSRLFSVCSMCTGLCKCVYVMYLFLFPS